MSDITIRNLEDRLKCRLRVLAAKNGRTVEEEVKAILHESMGEFSPRPDLYDLIRSEVDEIGGVDLDLPPRELAPEPPSFE